MQTLARQRSLQENSNFFACDIWSGNLSLESSALDLGFGMLGILGLKSAIWDLWLGIFGLGSSAWDPWLGIFGI